MKPHIYSTLMLIFIMIRMARSENFISNVMTNLTDKTLNEISENLRQICGNDSITIDKPQFKRLSIRYIYYKKEIIMINRALNLRGSTIASREFGKNYSSFQDQIDEHTRLITTENESKSTLYVMVQDSDQPVFWVSM